MASSPTRLHVDVERFAFQCETFKRCFDSKETALSASERMMERGDVHPGCHITPYLCDRCDRWHVTNRVIVPMTRSGVPLRAVGSYLD